MFGFFFPNQLQNRCISGVATLPPRSCADIMWVHGEFTRTPLRSAHLRFCHSPGRCVSMGSHGGTMSSTSTLPQSQTGNKILRWEERSFVAGIFRISAFAWRRKRGDYWNCTYRPCVWTKRTGLTYALPAPHGSYCHCRHPLLTQVTKVLRPCRFCFLSLSVT